MEDMEKDAAAAGKAGAASGKEGAAMGESKKQLVKEYIEAIGVALLLALFVRSFFVQAYKIPSSSMVPTLLIGDHILVNKFIYAIGIPFTDKKLVTFSIPNRGDVIVFKYPEDPSRDFIKRVVGVEGDTLEIIDRVVYVNGKPQDEPFTQHVETPYQKGIVPRDNLGPLVVPKNSLFVMGDNRDRSHDSRFWGFVNLNLVRGKAFIIYWSWDSTKTWVRFDRIGRLLR